MKQKTANHQFFTPPTTIPVSQEHDSLEGALKFTTKNLEGLIAYNEMMLLELEKIPGIYALEIFLASCLNLKDVQKIIETIQLIELPELMYAFIKAQYINKIQQDLKYLKDLTSVLDSANIDNLYLTISFYCKLKLNLVQTPEHLNLFKKALGLVNDIKTVNSTFKTINTLIQKQDKKVAILEEVRFYSNLMKILNPHISGNTKRFLDESNLSFDDSTCKMCYNYDSYYASNMKKKKSQHQNTTNTDLKNLLNSYTVDELFIKKQTTNATNYINEYKKASALYTIEKEMDVHIALIKTEPAPQSIKKAPLKKKNQANQPKKTPVVVLGSTENTGQINNALKPPTPLIPREHPVGFFDDQKENIPFVSPHIIKEPVEATNTIQEAELSLKQINELPIEAVADNYSDDDTDYSYKPFNKVVNNPVQLPQLNVLNLKPKHIDTLQKVFGLLSYDFITVRALASVAKRLGATIHTTGANRCRIELKNIHAFILTPIEAMEKPCNAATVTTHGGGHRSTRSANNDKAKAPTYLVRQFENAFRRAGFTEVNLGITLEAIAATIPRM